jgi:hypothetical protein
VSKYFLLASSGLLLFIYTQVMAGENWEVVIDTDPASQNSTCLMESATHVIDDGQTETPVKLLYTGLELYAITKSNIDLSYPETGLQIDSQKRFQVDQLHNKNTVVFNKKVKKIHTQLIHGKKAKLALGFWPTWPRTHTRIIAFDLTGYTKTYEKFVKCKKTGKL